ncbi:hypothetical protein R9C00_27890 [Flammeovirgaceae bacterium SG7u.111]|nr:hypothetical protein [Flammeovirgaceae bacterium SG7u.132]WPO35522.1 hypothetical protein R9C00_27890 [Flammeovirgaceae bacterium SG7u.111]
MKVKEFLKKIKLPENEQVNLPSLKGVLDWSKYTIEKMKGWDWKVISICFGTAFTFWIFNALNDSHTDDVSIPVELLYDGENVVTLVKPPESITVNVSGNGWNLLNKVVNVAQEPIEVMLNKKSLLELNHIMTNNLLPQVVNRFREMQVNYILEDSLYFDFDTIATKKVQLALRESDIELKDNYKIISSLKIEPDEAILTGAATLLSKYPDTIRIFLDETDIDADFEQMVKIAYPEHRLVSVDTEETKVKFMVAQFDKRTMRVKPEVVNFTIPEGKKITIIPSEATVEYMIEVDEHYIPQDSLKVLLDYRTTSKVDSTISAQLKYPSYMIETNVVPKKFVISIGDE